MNTPTFPRPGWQALRKQSTLRDLKTLLTSRVVREHELDEYAYRVLHGPIWTFTTIVDFLCNELKTKNRPMTIPELRTLASREHYDMSVVNKGLTTLDTLANVGRVWNKERGWVEYHYYPREERDDLSQEALDTYDQP